MEVSMVYRSSRQVVSDESGEEVEEFDKGEIRILYKAE